MSEKSGIAAYTGRTMGVTAADFDGDGYPDIYVANDKTENFLFHNKHDGTFEEIAADAGVAYGQNGESTSAMGPVFADIDNDGKLDLWVTDSKYNRLMRNNGKMQFDDIGTASGISPVTAQYVSWGTGIYDFDNDGMLDIMTFHGGLIHLIPEEHSIFRGLGNGKFADVSSQAGPVFDVKTVARGACFGDYDNDGKIDAFLVNLGAPATLFHNVSSNTGPLDHDSIEGHEEQSRRHWRASRSDRRREEANRRAGFQLRISLAGRRTRALRIGRGEQGREADGEVAQRTRAGTGEPGGRSHPHGGGAEVSAAPPSASLPDPQQSRRRMAVAVVFGFLAFTLSAKAKPDSDEARYLSPREMVLSPDGRRLYVMCEASDEVRVVDTSSGKVLQIVAVGHMPRGISLSPDGQQIFVANSWDDTVSVIDASSLKVVRTLATGFEPNSVIADREGKTLYVANRLSNDISVIDLQSGQETKRLLAGRGASYLALVARRQAAVLHARVSAHRRAPHSAGIGSHGDRYGAAKSRRAQATAQRGRCVPHCALG